MVTGLGWPGAAAGRRARSRGQRDPGRPAFIVVAALGHARDVPGHFPAAPIDGNRRPGLSRRAVRAAPGAARGGPRSARRDPRAGPDPAAGGRAAADLHPGRQAGHLPRRRPAGAGPGTGPGPWSSAGAGCRTGIPLLQLSVRYRQAAGSRGITGRPPRAVRRVAAMAAVMGLAIDAVRNSAVPRRLNRRTQAAAEWQRRR